MTTVKQEKPSGRILKQGMLSIQEAANFLGVHPQTLRKWDREGILPAIRFCEGGDRRYRIEDLMDFYDKAIATGKWQEMMKQKRYEARWGNKKTIKK